MNLTYHFNYNHKLDFSMWVTTSYVSWLSEQFFHFHFQTEEGADINWGSDSIYKT